MVQIAELNNHIEDININMLRVIQFLMKMDERIAQSETENKREFATLNGKFEIKVPTKFLETSLPHIPGFPGG